MDTRCGVVTNKVGHREKSELGGSGRCSRVSNRPHETALPAVVARNGMEGGLCLPLTFAREQIEVVCLEPSYKPQPPLVPVLLLWPLGKYHAC